MRDPLPKNNFGKFGNNSNFNQNTQNSFQTKTAGPTSTQSHSAGARQSSGTNVPMKKRKPDYCWYFNSGNPCKYGKKCRFIEKCSYCDSTEHPVLSCPKLLNRAEKKD